MRVFDMRANFSAIAAASRDLLADFSAHRKAHADQRERAEIARIFNDRYTYRRRFDKSSSERLPGSGMCGITPKRGNAWMCPECNRIHLAKESSVFTGLVYDPCCSTRHSWRYDSVRTDDIDPA